MTKTPPPGDDEPWPARWWPLGVLAALMGTGLLLQALDVIDWRATLQWARDQAQHGWLVAALIAVQVLLFMFALPGSTLLWLVAPLYPPLVSTAILTAGGSLGALAAYFLARRLSDGQRVALQRRRLYRVLEARADALALLGMRLLPGFPHSVMNYGAGILRLPVTVFLATTAAGFAVKAFLYSQVIYHAAQAELSEVARPDTLLALLALAVLAFAARFFRRRRGAVRPPAG